MAANISLDDLEALIQTKIQEATDPLHAKILELTEQVRELRGSMGAVIKEVDDVNQQGRKEYLILDGDAIPEHSDTEDTRKVTVDVLKKQLDISVPESDITACHRLQNKAKIIFRCRTRDIKDDIYSCRMAQQNTRNTLYVKESLTPRRNAQVALLVDMKKEGSISNFYTRNGVIHTRKDKNREYVKIQPNTSKEDVIKMVNDAPRKDPNRQNARHGTRTFEQQPRPNQGARGGTGPGNLSHLDQARTQHVTNRRARDNNQ